uniref:F-box domain-containing protein n=1 Tax=Anopheles farauti TaxID=69004 RepID=A0A182QAN8_9DIPT
MIKKENNLRKLSLTIMESNVSDDETDCLSLKLPPEILHKIFGYLDSTSVKNAACTCHYWAHAFESYCSKRFMLHICQELWIPDRCISQLSVCRYAPSCPHRYSSPVPLEEIADTLKHSTRRYNAIRLDICSNDFNDQAMESILQTVFRDDWLPRLQILELGLGRRNVGLVNYTLRLSFVLPHMRQLKQLALLHTDTISDVGLFPYLEIENDSLEVLILSAVVPKVINCPKMHRLAVSSCLNIESTFGRQYALGNERHWKLRQLQELVVALPLPTDPVPKVLECRPGYSLLLYQQLTALKKLTLLNMHVSERLFQGICESCVLLERLIIKFLRLIDPDALRSLSNLSRLQQLIIYHVVSPRPISFAYVEAPLLRKIRIGPDVECNDIAYNPKRISFAAFVGIERRFFR